MCIRDSIGVPRESRPGETRVAATPKTVEQLLKLGYQVAVEAGAGAAASFDDAAYAAAGATVAHPATVWGADIVTKICLLYTSTTRRGSPRARPGTRTAASRP